MHYDACRRHHDPALAPADRSPLPGNDDRYVGCPYHGRAYRSQHAGPSTATVAANDEQLCRARFFEQMTRGVVVHDNAPNRDVGIAVLPAGQPLCEDLVRPGLHRRGFHGGHRRRIAVAPGVQRHQFDISQ